MNDKITVEFNVAEFNLVMKQLSIGQLGECLDLFMRLNRMGQEFQQRKNGQPVDVPPPPKELN